MNRKKVLLVEDSTLAQMICKSLLEKNNCDVDVVDTGESGVAACLSNHYDLVFMDIGLPKMDGITAAKKIRQQENPGHRVPIIALTAHGDDRLKTNALQAGIDCYLIKPLTAETAQRLLKKYGGGRPSDTPSSSRKRGR